jgi:hypothetical protein
MIINPTIKQHHDFRTSLFGDEMVYAFADCRPDRGEDHGLPLLMSHAPGRFMNRFELTGTSSKVTALMNIYDGTTHVTSQVLFEVTDAQKQIANLNLVTQYVADAIDGLVEFCHKGGKTRMANATINDDGVFIAAVFDQEDCKHLDASMRISKSGHQVVES